ncbi:hypothetical protein D9M69_639730 [compost metagenome]
MDLMLSESIGCGRITKTMSCFFRKSEMILLKTLVFSSVSLILDPGICMRWVGAYNISRRFSCFLLNVFLACFSILIFGFGMEKNLL